MIVIGLTLLSVGIAGWYRSRFDVIQATRSTPQDLFGQMVVLDGQRLAVAAGRDSEREQAGGAVYIFEQQANRWLEVAKLFPILSVPYQYFGSSVALSGDLLAVTGCSDRGIFESGAVFIFQYQNRQWQEVQQLETGNCTTQANLLALQDGLLAVGFRGSREVGVYRWTSGQFQEEAILTPRETRIYSITDQFARLKAVGLDNGRIVMGLEDGAGVFVFDRTPSGWVEGQKLTVLEASLMYGTAVAIQNGQIIVGDPKGWACQGSDCVIGGAAYLFQFDGTVWQEVIKLQADRPVENGWFGGSVQLADEAAIVGAPLEIAGSFGAVYHFSQCSGQWQQRKRLVAGLYPRTEYALTRGLSAVTELAQKRVFAPARVVTAVKGGYQYPVQIAAGPALALNNSQILVGPTRGNLTSQRLIYQFERMSCR